MKIYIFSLLMSWALVSCSHTPDSVPQSDLAFPHGKYEHRVKVALSQPAKTMKVHGVIESEADQLKIVGISGLGTTVFRIHENLKTGEVSKEFYVDALRKNEERVMFFYGLMKELLNTPKGSTEFERHGAKFALKDPDKNQIYRTIEIQHPQVQLNIEVTKYEL